jgi:HlyD family secretion protein
MDRALDPAIRRRRLLRRWLPAVGGGALILVLLALTTGWLRPSVRRDRVLTAPVERGPVSATLDASGLVVPEFEQMLTAPLPTRVAAILKRPGAEVAPGEAIVQLHDEDARREADRLDEMISLKRNEQKQAELDLERKRGDLDAQLEIKALELKSFEFEVARNLELFDLGLINKDEVRKAETDVARTIIELAHLRTQLANSEADIATRLQGLALETSILDKDRHRARETLARTTVTSDRAGIVTWVVANEGATVAEGDPVARVADLTAYRVDAVLSDVLARKLTAGLPATVRSGDEHLSGRIHRILPTVENGIVTFEVLLDINHHPILRPNLRVDVHAVTDHREVALRLKRGPLLSVDGHEAVFVLRGERAVRTLIEIGLSSFEFYEITSGLAEGDEVIISDMSDFRNMKEVKLR